MTKKLFIAGNWKMNMTVEETKEFFNKIKSKELDNNKEILICPSMTSLPIAKELTNDSAIQVGAQNMHYMLEGAFTGEVSPLMLKELCEYVIIGHSERRNI